jgi:hypothetical protein
LKNCHRNLSTIMRNAFRKPLRILTLLFPRMWCIEGVERGTGRQLSIIWCGPELQQAYILSRVFGEDAFDRRYVGRHSVFRLKHLQGKFGCPLGFIAGPKWLLSLMRRENDIEIPLWLEAEIDLHQALDPAGRPSSLKEDLRRTRKNKLESRRASDFESYRHFYHQYYLPTVVGAHGASTLCADFGDRWYKISSGNADLFWVMMNDEPICGMVVSYDGEVPYMRDVGIRNGDRSLLKTGAATAAYYFVLQELEKRGYDRASLGVCRPFLDDGVLNFKEKWHPKLSYSTEESFLIRVATLCAASRSFLCECSHIGEDAGELHFALIAANDDDFRSGEPKLDRLSSIYGIEKKLYIDVSGQKPQLKKVG